MVIGTLANPIRTMRVWTSIMTGTVPFCIACLLITASSTAGDTSTEIESYLRASISVDFNEKESANIKALRDVVALALATETREAATFVKALVAVDKDLLGERELPKEEGLAASMTHEQRAGLARACYPVVRGLAWQLEKERSWGADARTAALLHAFAFQGCSALTQLEAADAYLRRAASGNIHCSPKSALAIWDNLILTLCRQDESAMPSVDRLAAVAKLIGDDSLTIESRVRLSIFQLVNPTREAIERDFTALRRDLMAIVELYPDESRQQWMERAETITQAYLTRAPRYAKALETMPAIRRSAEAVIATLQANADTKTSIAWMTDDVRQAMEKHSPRQIWLGTDNAIPDAIAWVQPLGTLGDDLMVRVVIAVDSKDQKPEAARRIARVWRFIETPAGTRIEPQQ